MIENVMKIEKLSKTKNLENVRVWEKTSGEFCKLINNNDIPSLSKSLFQFLNNNYIYFFLFEQNYFLE